MVEDDAGRFTQRIEAQALWFQRQPSNGPVQELREFIHNSRAVGTTLNASKAWVTLSVQQAPQGQRLRLVIGDNGRGMSFAELKEAMQLAPRTEADSMLGRHGEGMKMSMFHLRRNADSRIYIFAHQGEERTVAVLGSDKQNFASVTLLPIPSGFYDNPGAGTESDLVSTATQEEQAATRNAVPKVTRLPGAGGVAGDPMSPYNLPGELVQVFANMQERASSGLRVEIYDPVEGREMGGQWLGPALILGDEVQPGGQPNLLVRDADGDAVDFRDACGTMFLPPDQEICTPQFLQSKCGRLEYPFRLEVEVNGELAHPALHPWTKAVEAGKRAVPKRVRTGRLTIGDNMGHMQIMEVQGQVLDATGTGILYVWPRSDAVCNLKPVSPDLGNGVYDFFWNLAKDGHRSPGRIRQLWEWLGQLCGGGSHLQEIGLTWELFQDICRSSHDPGRDFLYAICLDKRLALVQMSDHQWASYVDRTKMDVKPLRPFAEALMRTLVKHYLNQYLKYTTAATSSQLQAAAALASMPASSPASSPASTPGGVGQAGAVNPPTPPRKAAARATARTTPAVNANGGAAACRDPDAAAPPSAPGRTNAKRQRKETGASPSPASPGQRQAGSRPTSPPARAAPARIDPAAGGITFAQAYKSAVAFASSTQAKMARLQQSGSKAEMLKVVSDLKRSTGALEKRVKSISGQ